MRILSFNLRYDNPADGENQWIHRVPSVIRQWRDVDADLAGVQEALPHMMNTLSRELPEYGWIGRGRKAGGGGEFSAIFYKKAAFEPIDHGVFWLSDTPDVPGSRTYGNRVIRVATWARLRRADGSDVFYVNTHLDHAVEEARQKGARQLYTFIQDNAGDAPVIITGDFNALPDSVAVKTFTEGGFTDALAAQGATGGTFHNFTGETTGRIDYVFFRGTGMEVEKAAVADTPIDGRYASDHFPVWADLRLPS